MRARPGTRWRGLFLAAIGSLAVVVLVAAGRAARDVDLPAVWAPALVLLVTHVVARRFPLRAGGRNRVEFSACTTLGFALLILVPVPVAVLALTAAALVPPPGGMIGAWQRRVFEVARATLVFAAAGWIVTVVEANGGIGASGGPPWQLLVLLLPAGIVAYAVDATLSALSVALDQQVSLRVVLHQQRARFDAGTYLLLVACAPFVVVLVEANLLLAPAVLAAFIALHRLSGGGVRQQDALHDALTGLPNRRQVELRLSELISMAREGDRYALLLMDLDRFTEVNEQLGHELGDKLLCQVADRLAALDDVDLAARLGGDEFAFVVIDSGRSKDLLAQAQELIAEVARPYAINGIRMSVSASIGVAAFPDHGLDTPSVLRRADAALYDAKRDRVPVVVATTQLDEQVLGRVSLVGELEEAMRRDELQLEYQPKLCLHTLDVVGVESLLRWHHPRRGLVRPDAFVTTVEHTDLIAPMTRHVLRKALRDLQQWQAAGLHGVSVAVNISSRDLQDLRFPDELERLLRQHTIDASCLTLEITETALQVDPERAARTMTQLRHLGIRLSIDDFGTGYSSLAALRHLPVNELKIDRVFVAGMGDDDAGTAIVRSMIQLGQALQLEVVAEGVEHEQDLEALRTFGCDIVQGFVVGRPVPAADVVPWIRARRDELASMRTLPFARAVHAMSRPRARSRVG